MTLRARPVARRRGRAGWDSGERRNSLINLGFTIAIAVSALILVGYGIFSWYDSHFGAAATVNGVVITKDQFVSRLRVENFRLDYIENRIRTLMAKGRITQDDGQQQISAINQRRQQLAGLTLERLVDIQLMSQLAGERNLTATEAQIDEQLVEEATTNEQRHVWMIEIDPNVDPETGEVEDEQDREALGRAQRALARLKNGESWEDVARTASDSALAPQAGDLSWLAEESGYDQAFMKAVFAAEINVPTEIVKGEDGSYRIGRYTEVSAKELDAGFQTAIVENGIPLAEYREAARGDVIRQELTAAVVAELKQPAPQRDTLEIYIPEPNTSSSGFEVGAKVRWIVYAPNDDMAKAEDLPLTDPAWAKAKREAELTYAALKTHPNSFDSRARAESDEASAKGTGGKQPYIYGTTTIDPAIRVAALATGLQPGQLLAPLKGTDGWYVIQFMRSSEGGEDAWLESLKAKATSPAAFRQLAIDNSQAPDAKDGGDLGFITRGQMSAELEKVIFEAPVGGLSEVVSVENDGYYLFMVEAEETREPTEEQAKTLDSTGFQTWYTGEKTAADIEYLLGGATTG